MGLFGFGKKKREREEAEAKAENREDEAAVDTEETAAPTDVADDVRRPRRITDRGTSMTRTCRITTSTSTWAPTTCRISRACSCASRRTAAPEQVLGATISYGASSLEIEAFAAPKTMGLWDDVRADLLEANEGIRTRGRVRHRTPPAGHRQGRQDGDHPHRRRGRPALDAARHLLRQGRER